MRLLISWVLLVTSSAASAEKSVRWIDVELRTGLNKTAVLAATQRHLEQLLYYDNDGISCGLESYVAEGLEISSRQSQGRFTAFSVLTTVRGPVGYCSGYSNYPCRTEWELLGADWKAVHSECERLSE